jgi:hypothetical protein
LFVNKEKQMCSQLWNLRGPPTLTLLKCLNQESCSQLFSLGLPESGSLLLYEPAQILCCTMERVYDFAVKLTCAILDCTYS